MKEYVQGRRAAGISSDVATKSKVEQELEEEFAMDFSPDELHEFLAADLVEVPVDPEFKERLRQKLWDAVRQRYGKAGPPRLLRKRDS